MIIKVPPDVNKIVHSLQDAGYEAYTVGGCVRDSILGRIPEDWDITTSAAPSQVKAEFRRTIDTGIQHGTVTVLIRGKGYEVTTYRVDGDYEDHRHPDEVAFSSSLKEDLKRRDFTINAMAYNDAEGLIDCFGGLEDLKAGIIRCVGKPEERFFEDALRIMRAVRFSAQLGFKIEENTERELCKLADSLSFVSKERIQTELIKLLVSNHPEYFRLLYEAGLTPYILPEFQSMMETEQHNCYHCYNVGEHTLKMMEEIQADPVLRLTALLHDCGKPWTKRTDASGEDHFKGHAAEGETRARRVLKDLKFDNATISKVCMLIHWHDYRFDMTKPDVKIVLNGVGRELFLPLLEVCRADTLAKSPAYQPLLLEAINRVRLLYEEILENAECVFLNELAVNGSDLIEAGIKPGKALGQTLHSMLTYIWKHPEQNTKEYLMKHLGMFNI